MNYYCILMHCTRSKLLTSILDESLGGVYGGDSAGNSAVRPGTRGLRHDVAPQLISSATAPPRRHKMARGCGFTRLPVRVALVDVRLDDVLARVD